MKLFSFARRVSSQSTVEHHISTRFCLTEATSLAFRFGTISASWTNLNELQDSLFILNFESGIQSSHTFMFGDCVVGMYQSETIGGVTSSIYAPGKVRLFA